MSTVHAGTAEEALWRLETLALTGDRPASEHTVRRQLLAAIDVIVLVERHHAGRRVGHVVRVTQDDLVEVYRCS